MKKSTTVSGTTKTAPDSAPAKAQDSKIMVLAIHQNQDNQIIITPIDIEHQTDDLTLMAEPELKARKLLDGEFLTKQKSMTEALAALFEIFNHRLYRNQFRTFENFCFAMFGTNRINDVMMKKAGKKVAELAADLKEEI